MRALESALVERGFVDPAALDALIETYETKVGPHNGARVVARAWVDPAYRERLFDRRHRGDRRARLQRPPGRAHGRAGEHAGRAQPRRLHALLVLPVDGARAPAGLVQERALPLARGVRSARRAARLRGDVPDETTIRVWDSTAEVRYLVVPMRPPGTEGLGEDELAALVTRDAMIGTGVL